MASKLERAKALMDPAEANNYQETASQLRKFHETSIAAYQNELEAEGDIMRSRLKQRLADRRRTILQAAAEANVAPEIVNTQLEKLQNNGDQEMASLNQEIERSIQERLNVAQEAGNRELNGSVETVIDLVKMHEKHNQQVEQALSNLESEAQIKRNNLAQKLREKRDKLAKSEHQSPQVIQELAKEEARATRDLENDLQANRANLLYTITQTNNQQLLDRLKENALQNTLKEKFENDALRIRSEHSKALDSLNKDMATELARRREKLRDQLKRAKDQREAMTNQGITSINEIPEQQQSILDEFTEEAAQDDKKLADNLRLQVTMEVSNKMAANESENENLLHLQKIRENHERHQGELTHELEAIKRRKEETLREKLAQKRAAKEAELAAKANELSNHQKAVLAQELEKELVLDEKKEWEDFKNELQAEHDRLLEKSRREREEEEMRQKLKNELRAQEEAARAKQSEDEARSVLERLQKTHKENSEELERQLASDRQKNEARMRNRLKERQEAHRKQLENDRVSKDEAAKRDAQLAAELEAEKHRMELEMAEEEKRRREEVKRAQEAEQERLKREFEQATAAASAALVKAEALRISEKSAQEAERNKDLAHLQELKQKNEEQAKKVEEDLQAEKKRKEQRLQQRKEALKKSKQEETAKKNNDQIAEQMAKVNELKAKLEEAKKASNDTSWKQVVRDIMKEAESNDQTRGWSDNERELFALSSVAAKKIVPAHKMGDCVELIMNKRHISELTNLSKSQYAEKSQAHKDKSTDLLERKLANRTALTESLSAQGAPLETITSRLDDLDREFAEAQQRIDHEVDEHYEPIHAEQLSQLRQSHMKEIAEAVALVATDGMVNAVDLEVQKKELEEFQERMQREKEERIRKLQEDKIRFEEQLRKNVEEEMQRIEQESAQQLEKERAEQARIYQQKQEEMARTKMELESKAANEEGNYFREVAEQKIKKHEEDVKAQMSQLQKQSDLKRQQLDERLNARRKKLIQDSEAVRQRENQKKDQQIEMVAKTIDEVVKNEVEKAAVINEVLAEENPEKRSELIEQATSNQHQTPIKLEWVERKLDSIERMLAALQQERSNNPPRQSGVLNTTEIDTDFYQDALDRDLEMKLPANQVEGVIESHALAPNVMAKIEFGTQLIHLLGMGGRVTLHAAKSFPRNETRKTAFKSSFYYDHERKQLFVHESRLESSGDLSLVLLHAISHIKVDPNDMSDDTNPRFVAEFHRNLKLVSQELFRKQMMMDKVPVPHSADEFRSLRGRGSFMNIIKEGREGGPSTNVSPRPEEPTASPGYFEKSKMNDRMKLYAAAVGNPKYLEFANRYEKESQAATKASYTLDEDQEGHAKESKK